MNFDGLISTVGAQFNKTTAKMQEMAGTDDPAKLAQLAQEVSLSATIAKIVSEACAGCISSVGDAGSAATQRMR